MAAEWRPEGSAAWGAEAVNRHLSLFVLLFWFEKSKTKIWKKKFPLSLRWILGENGSVSSAPNGKHISLSADEFFCSLG
jgi:hypothetical protein